MPEGQIITAAPGPASVDYITGFGGSGAAAHGSIAAALLNGDFKANSMRTLDLLRKEEWLLFDTAVIDVARERLGLVQDLITRGLRFPLPNAMGTTVLQWERISDMDPATASMAAVTEGEYDRIVFELQTMPVPIFHKEFTLNIRHLASSRKLGETIDVTQARVATRKVAELVENTFVNGLALQAVGGSIEGLTTATDRNTGSLTNNWAGATPATGEEILTDLIAMKAALKADHMFGPYGVYIPETYDDVLDADFKANSDKSIRQRVSELSNISFIRPTERLTTSVIMAQLTSDVLQVIDGIQPRTIQWETHGGLVVNFKVIAIILPRIRSDYTNQSGVAHYSEP